MFTHRLCRQQRLYFLTCVRVHAVQRRSRWCSANANDTVPASNGPTMEKGSRTGEDRPVCDKKSQRRHGFSRARSRSFLVLNDNPPTNQYVLAPKRLEWFAVFSFDPAGYVRDDEKIDSNQLLAQLKANNIGTNEERQRQGLSPLVLESWSVPPHYDVDTKRLEWGTLLRTPSGETVVNYTTRILGRSGIIRGLLVSEPATLEADIRAFKQALRGLQYVSGETYARLSPAISLRRTVSPPWSSAEGRLRWSRQVLER